MHQLQEIYPITCNLVHRPTSKALLLNSASITSVKCIFGIKKKWSLPKNVLNLSLEKGLNAAIPHVSSENHFREFLSNSFADCSWCRNKTLHILGHSPKAPTSDYSVSYWVSSCAALIINQAIKIKTPLQRANTIALPTRELSPGRLFFLFKICASNLSMSKGPIKHTDIGVSIIIMHNYYWRHLFVLTQYFTNTFQTFYKYENFSH